MKHGRRIAYPAGGAIDRPTAKAEQRTPALRKRRRRWWRVGLWFLLLAGVAGVVRAMLPGLVRNYVNRTLDRNLRYSGRIGEVRLHLLRSAYSIHDVHFSKTSGNVPVP